MKQNEKKGKGVKKNDFLNLGVERIGRGEKK